MHIVSMVKFAIGIVFLLIGVGMFVRSHGTRGFNQSRQAGALFLIGGVLFLAIGLGWLDIKGLLG